MDKREKEADYHIGEGGNHHGRSKNRAPGSLEDGNKVSPCALRLKRGGELFI